MDYWGWWCAKSCFVSYLTQIILGWVLVKLRVLTILYSFRYLQYHQLPAHHGDLLQLLPIHSGGLHDRSYSCSLYLLLQLCPITPCCSDLSQHRPSSYQEVYGRANLLLLPGHLWSSGLYPPVCRKCLLLQHGPGSCKVLSVRPHLL